MVPGLLQVRGTALGFLFIGLSWQHLWWSDLGDMPSSRHKVIGSGGRRYADGCNACGMIAFSPSLPQGLR